MLQVQITFKKWLTNSQHSQHRNWPVWYWWYWHTENFSQYFQVKDGCIHFEWHWPRWKYQDHYKDKSQAAIQENSGHHGSESQWWSRSEHLTITYFQIDVPSQTRWWWLPHRWFPQRIKDNTSMLWWWQAGESWNNHTVTQALCKEFISRPSVLCCRNSRLRKRSSLDTQWVSG